MLKLRPLTETFRLPYQWDPAIDQSQFTKDGVLDVPSFDAAYARCAETLDFSPILRAGQDPTWFVFRVLRGTETRRILSMDVATPTLLPWFVFRVALHHVDNLGELKVDLASDPRYPDFGKIATSETTDALDELTRGLGRQQGELVTALGMLVLQRSMGASGK